MRPQGRSPIPLSEKDIEAVKEYLNTDKSLVEVSAVYGMSAAGLRYKVKKFKKDEELRHGEKDS